MILTITISIKKRIIKKRNIIKKVRKIIVGIRYSQENKRNFDIQVKALEINNPRLPQLDQKTRWSSTANMLKDFLHVWQAIKIVISLSTTKSFEKNKEILILKDSEIAYLEKCLKIFNIFIKPTIKLQAEKYSTIYYLLPEVYKLYTRLEGLKEEINDLNFTDAINRGLIKLRKYYPKTGNINENNKSLYLALILDPRIKQEGLEVIGLSRNQAFEIYNRLKEVYNIFKVDFALANPPIEEAQSLALEDSDDDSDIYI
ncbi:hypothetical protein BKA65DRAFT_485028 [Rhexocercosporidium sp. MPI-PUGE-AT-0058]|nr:hypothetical protein BKA65DRAFT_485028 [Rhexocercosporidium sp. MPI-PUGE-AT-0058]